MKTSLITTALSYAQLGENEARQWMLLSLLDVIRADAITAEPAVQLALGALLGRFNGEIDARRYQEAQQFFLDWMRDSQSELDEPALMFANAVRVCLEREEPSDGLEDGLEDALFMFAHYLDQGEFSQFIEA
ncbi:hypothetical protein ONV78_16810 [Hahella sp. CR1]|uniref:hypothetical protein n=1 Tax=Hahella sp. CR1 TaxID=2992807 RepID=UPI002442EBAF|nr:hypothetical protein [Hahella sp. CR1]MDG9669402.1 hypothetical protein [Hahella sp. CR1]